MIHHDSKIQDSGSGSGVLCGGQHGGAPAVFCDPGSCSRSGRGKSAGCTSFGQPGWMSLLQPEWTALERWTTGPGRLLEPGPTAPLLGRRRPGTGAAELKKRGVKEFTPPVTGRESQVAGLDVQVVCLSSIFLYDDETQSDETCIASFSGCTSKPATHGSRPVT